MIGRGWPVALLALGGCLPWASWEEWEKARDAEKRDSGDTGYYREYSEYGSYGYEDDARCVPQFDVDGALVGWAVTGPAGGGCGPPEVGSPFHKGRR